MPTLTLVVSLLAAHLAVDEDDEPLHHELSVAIDGGLSAGLPIAGYGGGTFRYEYRFDSGLFLGALSGLNLGVGMLDPRLNFVAGAHLISTRRVDWLLMLYTGWPLAGLQTKLEVSPLLFQHFVASLGVRASGELLWNVEGDAFVKLAFPVHGWVPSLRAAVDAGAGVRSGAHVGANLALQVARAF